LLRRWTRDQIIEAQTNVEALYIEAAEGDADEECLLVQRRPVHAFRR
jgi:hypothetical protein